MFKLLAKLWRWLKRWFVRQPPPPPPPPTQPSDLDYENVVLALLAEVAQGKTWGQLQGFLMSRNVNQQRLAAWLQEFGQRWLAQPEVHQELARRLRRLAEGATGELARVARELAEGLLVVPERDGSVITESAVSGGNEQGASLSEVEKLNQLLAGLKGSGSNQTSVSVSNSAIVSEAEFWFNQGVTLYELGRNEEALASFEQAISLQPDYYQAWSNRGGVFSELGRYEEALANFDQAISIQPDHYIAWGNRGVTLKNLGRYEEALANFDQAISIQPDYYPAWENRGGVFSELGRYEEALANFDQVISIQPDCYQAWGNRGAALSELGRKEEALASYDQVISIQPDCYQAWVNRGVAAINSFGYEYFWQQNFTDCFRLERNKTPDILIPTRQNTNRERHLALFPASLNSSTAFLKETFADSPNVIAQLEQPPSPKLSQLIQQLPSQTLIVFIQKPLSEDVIAKIAQDSLNHPSLTNPQLNLRGYEGGIASYQAPLDKTIRRDTHPEGWGVLHHQTGRAHYFQGRKTINPYSLWRKAETSYKTALQALKPPEFEELHLKVIQDLIWVLLSLKEIEEAKELQRRGADLLQRLLADPKRTTPQKQKLALKSALFNQLTVDLAIQSGDISGALTLAEIGKNTCLRWFLGYEEVPELDYRQIQRLLSPTTAAIYWHLSPSALTTFVIVPDALQVVLTQRFAEGNAEERRGFIELNDQRSESLQQVLAWEKWLTEWNQRYQAYRSSKEKANGTEKKYHPWRLQMAESFQELRAILNISGILEHLQNQPIENLILIPHSDLHRFPLHYFFLNYTCTYLPSAYSKLRLILEDE